MNTMSLESTIEELRISLAAEKIKNNILTKNNKRLESRNIEYKARIAKLMYITKNNIRKKDAYTNTDNNVTYNREGQEVKIEIGEEHKLSHLCNINIVKILNDKNKSLLNEITQHKKEINALTNLVASMEKTNYERYLATSRETKEMFTNLKKTQAQLNEEKEKNNKIIKSIHTAMDTFADTSVLQYLSYSNPDIITHRKEL